MLKVDGSINVDSARKEFEANGFAQVENLLCHDSSQMLLNFFQNQIDWNLSFQNGQKHCDISYRDFLTWKKEEKEVLSRIIYDSTDDKIRYLYKSIPIYDLVKSGTPENNFFKSIYDLVNSPEFLTLCKNITHSEEITFADCQATCFDKGHFLTLHDDNVAEKNRVAAYVLSMTPYWHPDWGGYLNLFDKKTKNITKGLAPKLNTLNIFTIPADHSVSVVTEFADKSRFSITGWLRTS